MIGAVKNNRGARGPVPPSSTPTQVEIDVALSKAAARFGGADGEERPMPPINTEGARKSHGCCTQCRRMRTLYIPRALGQPICLDCASQSVIWRTFV